MVLKVTEMWFVKYRRAVPLPGLGVPIKHDVDELSYGVCDRERDCVRQAVWRVRSDREGEKLLWC